METGDNVHATNQSWKVAQVVCKVDIMCMSEPVLESGAGSVESGRNVHATNKSWKVVEIVLKVEMKYMSQTSLRKVMQVVSKVG